MFMHSRIDFILFATVSHWSETAPYSHDPDPFQSAVFSRVVSDYTSPNLLSGSHMHNFGFGCSKRLFAWTWRWSFLPYINAFPSSLPFHQASQCLHILSAVSFYLLLGQWWKYWIALNLKFILILLPWLLQSTGDMALFFKLCPADTPGQTVFLVLSAILCPVYFSENERHPVLLLILIQNNLRNKIKQDSQPLHIFTLVHSGLSVGYHVMSS